MKVLKNVFKFIFICFWIAVLLYIVVSWTKIYYENKYKNSFMDEIKSSDITYVIDVNWKSIETYNNLEGYKDPLVVKLILTWYESKNLKDINWSYFPKDNENKILDTKLWLNSHIYFIVPLQSGMFSFRGILNYYSWESIDLYQMLWWPILTIWPDAKQPDIPMVTLKSDKINADVGEEIIFEVISKIASNRDDFKDKRVIQIDFDWDGEYDLTTKNNSVKYVYTKASPTESPYLPTASVIYRDYRGVWEWAPIVVKEWLNPELAYTPIGQTVLFRDISRWNIVKRIICFDKKKCDEWDSSYYNDTLEKSFKFTYPEAGTYIVTIYEQDNEGNEAENQLTITVYDEEKLTLLDDWLKFVSIPEILMTWDIPEILINRVFKNNVLYNIIASEDITICYVDSDINYDSSHDWDPSNDKDFQCNKIVTQEYDSNYESSISRIYYQITWSDILNSKDFIVTNKDFEKKIDSDGVLRYKLASQLIQTIEDNELRSLLVNLRNDISNNHRNARRWDLFEIIQYKEESDIKLTETQEEKLNNLINWINDYATLSVLWGSIYDIAKEEILPLLPQELKQRVNRWFVAFENIEWNFGADIKEQRASILESINRIIADSAVPINQIWINNIADDDYENIIKPNICMIAEEYDILLNLCNQFNKDASNTKIDLTNVELVEPSSSLPTFIKILLRLLAAITIGFLWILFVYARKYKKQNN